MTVHAQRMPMYRGKFSSVVVRRHPMYCAVDAGISLGKHVSSVRMIVSAHEWLDVGRMGWNGLRLGRRIHVKRGMIGAITKAQAESGKKKIKRAMRARS